MYYIPIPTTATLLLTACVCLIATASSAAHPIDNGAVALDTLTTSSEINLSAQPVVHGDVVLWLTSDSTLDIMLDIESITFSGTCTDLDSVPLNDLCDLLANSALDTALSSQYGSLALNGSVRVITHGWAKRFGSDVNTEFQVCNLFAFAIRTYTCAYTVPGWTWTLVFTGTDQCSTCAQNCESAIEEGMID